MDRGVVRAEKRSPCWESLARRGGRCWRDDLLLNFDGGPAMQIPLGPFKPHRASLELWIPPPDFRGLGRSKNIPRVFRNKRCPLKAEPSGLDQLRCCRCGSQVRVGWGSLPPSSSDPCIGVRLIAQFQTHVCLPACLWGESFSLGGGGPAPTSQPRCLFAWDFPGTYSQVVGRTE